MHTPALLNTDAMLRQSRRSLWTSFIVVGLLGLSGMAQLLAPAARAGHALAMLLPVVIVIGVVGLRRGNVPHAAGLQLAADDELRRQAIGRALRNSLIVVVGLQPLLAFGLSMAGLANGVAVMAGATTLAGALTFLGSVLYVDR